MKQAETDACGPCPAGQIRPDPLSGATRGISTLGNYSAWEEIQGTCHVKIVREISTPLLTVFGAVVAIILAIVLRRRKQLVNMDSLWRVDQQEVLYDDPVEVLGKGSFGEVWKATYRGTTVAVKKISFATDESRTSNLVSASATPTSNENEGMTPPKSKKVSPSSQLTARIIRRRFVEEMRKMSALRHPCIVAVIGGTRDPSSSHHLLVMEYCEFGSLRSLLSNQTFPLDPEQTLPMIRDVLQGLRYLHAANPPIIHGDLQVRRPLADYILTLYRSDARPHAAFSPRSAQTS